MKVTSDPALNSVRQITLDAGHAIKGFVIGEAMEAARENLPKMIVGVRDNKFRSECIIHGMMSSVDATVYGVEEEMRGITLWKDDQFWSKSSTVILTEEGIFRCGFVMSEPSNSKEQKEKGWCVLIQPRPDWTTRKESSDLYVKYGEQAILELRKLRKDK